MHEKGLQRQTGVGTLVNSQQRRALAVPVINRASTERFVPPPVYIAFPRFVLAKRRPGHFFTVRWRARGAVCFQGDRNVGTLFCPASPRPAVRHAPCRSDPPVVCPGLRLDRCLCKRFSCKTCREIQPVFKRFSNNRRLSLLTTVEPKTQTFPKRDRTGRSTAGRRGGARWNGGARPRTGSTRCRRDGSPRIKQPLVPSRRLKMIFLLCRWQHEQKKP